MHIIKLPQPPQATVELLNQVGRCRSLQGPGFQLLPWSGAVAASISQALTLGRGHKRVQTAWGSGGGAPQENFDNFDPISENFSKKKRGVIKTNFQNQKIFLKKKQVNFFGFLKPFEKLELLWARYWSVFSYFTFKIQQWLYFQL